VSRALELRSVVHSFDGRRVLHGASLTLEPGECVALLGANGSGKTTLLRLAAGLLQPDAGEILVSGTPAAAGRPDVGIAFQDSRLLSWRSAARNVSLPLELVHGVTPAVRASASAALTRVNGVALADRAPAELSGGERQRVALARALVREPALILLDEPFAALDAPTRNRFCEELPELIGSAAALLVTHDVAEALMVADRVLILGADGQIVGGWKGLRSLRAHERRAALLAPDGLAQQAQLLAALGGVTHV
jgi:ABC-type nitrate/sulfonate/bicarbonate transport system ATPase subunit